MFSFGITTRLWLAIFLTGLITAIMSGTASYWSFHEGLHDFLYEREVERAKAIVPSLGKAYREHGNWEFIRDDQRLDAERPPYLHEFYAGDRSRNRMPQGLILYDAQGRRVAGREEPLTAPFSHPIVVDGIEVGTLVGGLRPYLPDIAYQHFSQYQSRANWLVGLSVVLAISVLAFFFARNFLAPIRQLIAGAAQLAGGTLSARVPRVRNDELGTLAHSFNCMAEALQKNENMRRQFMADASHELRTPLTVLRAELEALEEGVIEFNLASVHSLQEEVTTLERRIHDIRQLSLADVGALHYNWRTVDLSRLLEEEQRRWLNPLANEGITLEIRNTAGLLVRGDRDRLEQLLGNLIENARYHAKGLGLLRLTLLRRKEEAIIECHDNGQGVAQDSLSKLFDRFWCEDDSRSHHPGGSGLGLSICNSIITAHGGRIEALHSELGGLCVRAYLPLERAAI